MNLFGPFFRQFLFGLSLINIFYFLSPIQVTFRTPTHLQTSIGKKNSNVLSLQYLKNYQLEYIDNLVRLKLKFDFLYSVSKYMKKSLWILCIFLYLFSWFFSLLLYITFCKCSKNWNKFLLFLEMAYQFRNFRLERRMNTHDERCWCWQNFD